MGLSLNVGDVPEAGIDRELDLTHVDPFTRVGMAAGRFDGRSRDGLQVPRFTVFGLFTG